MGAKRHGGGELSSDMEYMYKCKLFQLFIRNKVFLKGLNIKIKNIQSLYDMHVVCLKPVCGFTEHYDSQGQHQQHCIVHELHVW